MLMKTDAGRPPTVAAGIDVVVSCFAGGSAWVARIVLLVMCSTHAILKDNCILGAPNHNANYIGVAFNQNQKNNNQKKN